VVGCTALIVVAMHGKADVEEALLQTGTNINVQGKDGNSSGL